MRANATTTEAVDKQMRLTMFESLVELQLEAACRTAITTTDEPDVTVDAYCISKVNTLLNTLKRDPSLNQLVIRVSAFMEANNIPKTF